MGSEGKHNEVPLINADVSIKTRALKLQIMLRRKIGD